MTVEDQAYLQKLRSALPVDELIYAHCPNCNRLAYIYPYQKVQCSRCSFYCRYDISRLRGTSCSHWYGPVRHSGKCGHCGVFNSKQIIKYQKTIAIPMIRCKNCKKDYVGIADVIANNYYETTPYFGLDFWFINSVKGNKIWAYNPSHIRVLIDFISDPQRSKDLGEHSNKVYNLPKFMLLAKNRKLVLDALNKMLLKTPT